MSDQTCTICQTNKAGLECGPCQTPVCKYCAQFIDADTFSFFPTLPEDLKHEVYCNSCYDAKVAPHKELYEKTMAAAKEIQVFNITQGKETRFIRRNEKPVKVVDCPDYEEAVLRLAFFAALAGYNAIVDLDLSSKKYKDGTRQTTKWSGSAVPAQVESRKLVKDRSIWQNPN